MTSSAISREGSLDERDSNLTRLRRQGPEASHHGAVADRLTATETVLLV
jgi:hypothetical protein